MNVVLNTTLLNDTLLIVCLLYVILLGVITVSGMLNNIPPSAMLSAINLY